MPAWHIVIIYNCIIWSSDFVRAQKSFRGYDHVRAFLYLFHTCNLLYLQAIRCICICIDDSTWRSGLIKIKSPAILILLILSCVIFLTCMHTTGLPTSEGWFYPNIALWLLNSQSTLHHEVIVVDPDSAIFVHCICVLLTWLDRICSTSNAIDSSLFRQQWISRLAIEMFHV